MKLCHIYVLIDPENSNIRYIGQTINPKNRLRQHICHSSSKKNGKFKHSDHNSRWIRKILKNSKEPILKIIDSCIDGEESDDLESKYIKEYRNKGCSLTNNQSGGKKNSRIISEESRNKMSAAAILTNKGKGKPVLQYDLNGNFINEYESIGDSANKSNISKQQISSCCNGKIKSAGGYQWRFKKGRVIKKIKPYKAILLYSKKPILQYDLNGNFINEYYDSSDATNDTNISNIYRCCSNIQSSAGGYQWRFKKGRVIKKIKPYKRMTMGELIGHRISQYDLDGICIEEYVSIAQARRVTGITGISKCLCGDTKTAGGFKWLKMG